MLFDKFRVRTNFGAVAVENLTLSLAQGEVSEPTRRIRTA